MAPAWQQTIVEKLFDLYSRKNQGVEVWKRQDFISATQMNHSAATSDNWKREVASRRAGQFRKAEQQEGTKVMTLGAAERMLGEFQWEITQGSCARPMDHWPERELIAKLHTWVVQRIQGSPVPSYRYDRGSRSCEVRYVKNVRGEPWWVAEDVFRALGLQWGGHRSVAYIPEKWQPVELLPYGEDVKHRTCLYWPGVKAVMAGLNRPATWDFRDDLMARFGEAHPGMFQEFQ